MSIVTDALNLLQAERSPSVKSSSQALSSSVSAIFSRSHHQHVAARTPIMRQILQGLALIMVLGVIGLGAYLWGLTMVPTPPELSSPTIADSMGVNPSPSTMPGGETVQAEVAVTPLRDVSEAGTDSPASGPVEKQSVSESPEAALKTSIVSGPSATQATKQATMVPKAVQAPRVRRSTLPTTSSPPAEMSAEAEAVQPEGATAPVQKSAKPEGPSSTGPLVPSGKTVLEQRLSLVKQLINRKRYGQAMTLLQPLFIHPPEQWEPWFWRGTAHLGLGQLAQAEEAFVEGLARDSTIPHLWVQRALVSQQRGHFGEAVESLRQAELLAPELPEVQLNLAYSLETRGNTPLAVEHYHNFLALTEGNPAYHPARRKVLDRVIRLEKT